MLSRLFRNVLSDLLCGQLIVLEIPRIKLISVGDKLKAFSGYIDGLDTRSIDQAIHLVNIESVNKVFIDGSNFGELARVLRHIYPKLEIISFFHNAEVQFFWGAFKANRSLKGLAIFWCNYMAERKAVRHSSFIITLTNFDSECLYRWYGRRSSYIVPMALRDQFVPNNQPICDNEHMMLFVGGNFYANRLGIEWFIKHVMPFVEMRLFIVGQGMEVIRDVQPASDRVEVIGAVDDLGSWYRRAQFVVAPIFDGSGMKTKVAEALMHGKRIIGTSVAFEGYDDALPSAGWICNDADAFIKAIHAAQLADLPAMDPSLRQLYLDHYSLEAATKHFERILSS